MANKSSKHSLANYRRTKKKRRGFMRKKEVVLVENNNINTTTTETEVNIDFSPDVPSTSSASASSMNNSSLPVEDVSENIQIVSSAPVASITRMKKYRQLVNRSKMKLLRGAALQRDIHFKSKTRLQKSKLGLVKRDGVCSASGYKLIDTDILQDVLKKPVFVSTVKSCLVELLF